MRVIYEPKGRAKEYSPLALNIYTGCSHSCRYCYVPLALHRDKTSFRTNVKPREDILKKTERDCMELQDQGNKENILLCFACDPYQPIDTEIKLTRQIIKIFNNYDQNFTILTKGGIRAIEDFDLYKTGDEFATTLTFTNNDDSKRIEPLAAIPESRIESLKRAKEYGIYTWVSLEPVIYPDQTLALIDLSYKWVDKYKVGKINHFPDKEKSINWTKFANDVLNKLVKYKKSYYIKKDLEIYIGENNCRQVDLENLQN